MDLVGTIHQMRQLRSDLPDVEVKSARNGLPDSVVEALASGIPTALAALDESAMQRPRFFDQGLSFTVTIDRRVTAGTASRDRPAADRSNDLTTAETEILNVLATPATAAEIARAAGISLNATQKRLTSLRKKGVVFMSEHQGQRTTYSRV